MGKHVIISMNPQDELNVSRAVERVLAATIGHNMSGSFSLIFTPVPELRGESIQLELCDVSNGVEFIPLPNKIGFLPWERRFEEKYQAGMDIIIGCSLSDLILHVASRLSSFLLAGRTGRVETIEQKFDEETGKETKELRIKFTIFKK